MKSFGHYKVTIAVISFVILTLVAAVVSAVVIVVVLGRNTSISNYTFNYYNGSFRISNENYTDDYKNSQSDAYKSLSAQVEGLISKTFYNSDMKNQYSSAKVISISPGSVIPTFILLFNFANGASKNMSSAFVQKIFVENIKNIPGNLFDIDENSFKLIGK
ncbi:hypothetical protein XENTR_v10001056 [Xenopus tropicalis]|uniref:Transmembrane protease serine 11D-like n=1 Tax=Xenopus tropicalis TaxID=8364 RepID=A0A8J1JMV1_XENTR|nr:transmembrane protease serine 11D-like [Xenopus tropicalis]KAE8631044.1 hypothetical protein XENTR_v10001056 [Xenopus tropicalis]